MKVGVVGAGWIARRVHVPWLLSPEAKALGVVLLAVWDDDPEQLRDFAESFGVVRASSLSAMFELDLDLTFVLTDPQSHVAIVDRALAGGCHLSVRVMPPKAQAACQPPVESRRTKQGWHAACALPHDSNRQRARAVSHDAGRPPHGA